MTLSLYSSTKLLPHLGKKFVSENPEVDPNSVHPIYCWYADVYFLNRAKYLIICNEVSRFSLCLGPYKVDPKANFMDHFKKVLEEKLKEILPDYMDYFKSINGYGRLTQTHRGAMANLSRLKIDLDYSKSYYLAFENRQLDLPLDFEDQAETFTTRNGEKGYFRPAENFVKRWNEFKSEQMG